MGLIRDQTGKGRSAEAAVAEAIAEIEAMFQSQSNPYLRERSTERLKRVRDAPDASHSWLEEKPDLANEIIMGFLLKSPPRASSHRGLPACYPRSEAGRRPCPFREARPLHTARLPRPLRLPWAENAPD